MMYVSIEDQLKFTQQELQLLQANATAATDNILAIEIKTAVAVKQAVLASLLKYAEIRGSPAPEYDKEINYLKYHKGEQT